MQHAEPIGLSALTTDKVKHKSSSMCEGWKEGKARLLHLQKSTSKKVEKLQMESEQQRVAAQTTVKVVRDFWRDKIFERSTSGGMMLMAAARGNISRLDKYLEES